MCDGGKVKVQSQWFELNLYRFDAHLSLPPPRTIEIFVLLFRRMGGWNSPNEDLKRSSPVTKSKRLKTGVPVSEPLKDEYQTPEVPKYLDPPTGGVVRITYCEAGPLPRDQNFRPWHLDKVAEVTEQLARDGRRVIGHLLGIVM